MRHLPEYPVVLCHGLFGTRKYGVGPVSAGDYFRVIRQQLVQAGVTIETPHVHPTAGVYRRVWKLADRIKRRFGDQPVHLVGHSMGGLDCRLLASDPSWSRQIISLTTIGTPHFGTCLADLATSRLRHLLNGLEWLGLDVDGIHQVSTENMRKLTSDWSEPERTVCMSIAGNPMAEDTFFLMRPTRSWIFDRQGPNDGMVPMESALGWGEPLPPWNLDHLSQINWITPSHLHTELYQSYFLLMKKLAETEMNYSSRTIVASPDFEVIST